MHACGAPHPGSHAAESCGRLSARRQHRTQAGKSDTSRHPSSISDNLSGTAEYTQHLCCPHHRQSTWPCFGTEIENAEHHIGNCHRQNERIIHKAKLTVQQEQRDERCHSIRPSYAVYAVHKIDNVRCTYAHHKRNDDNPPHAQVQDVQLVEH